MKTKNLTNQEVIMGWQKYQNGITAPPADNCWNINVYSILLYFVSSVNFSETVLMGNLQVLTNLIKDTESPVMAWESTHDKPQNKCFQ